MKVFRVIALICATVMFVSGALSPASAHRQAESYVFFSQSENEISGRIEAILSDIDRMIPLDADQDGEITADEFNARTDEIFSFFADRLSISSGGTPHPLISSGFGILETPAGTFGQISFDLPDLDPKTETIDVTYEPLTDNDNPGHLGYGVIENNSNTGVVDNERHIALIFNPNGEPQQLNLIGDPWSKIFVDFVIHGIWHIWLGFDHVLFLVTLLLPAVLFRKSNDWAPVDEFKTAFINVIKIATVFTISHTITLSLAALGIVTLPVTLVEAVIAVSIAAVALGNMFPIWHHRVLPIVFIFGLFHGFGFANVLEPLGVVPSAKVVGLAAFNIGVEIGQVAIILVLFPILFVLRNWKAYPFMALKLGSVAIIIISGIWIVERSADTFWKYQQQLFAMVG